MFEDLRPHLIELRKRLIISAFAIIVCFVVCFNFWNPILAYMSAPLKAVLPDGSNIIFTQVAEPFFTAMKVAFFAGLLLALPVIFWQFWLFVAPGLYENEKKYVIPFVISATFMFLVGAAFCYYFVVPVGFHFLINFGGELFQALPSIGDYVGFFTKLIVAFGISFELPVVTFFLAKLGMIDDKTLKGFFRYAVVIIFIFAAIMTPPDVLSQFLLAIPLIALYALSIFIAKVVNPAKKNEEENMQENREEKQ
ncbi:twin-arginine translocase subunit TatC [Campylobacter fetus]|uniref:twin-arginine translocase subunit TatC n=1 Tax=Campylobacter fetus TaxID=196 RepID=UPI000FC9B195|nr:twin-arginine translocase subunit TatC [Campylobacter fetus]RUT51464.1 twin arginine-targeting protein translocase TatC [Campylobacter fetus]RUT52194.1 twin arginine-targeting protein translocase TatC [Campylobacter fetus]